MKLVSLSELRANPSALTSLIQAGAEVTIVDNGEEVAKITPAARRQQGQRPFALAKGQFEVPGDFNEPLPEELLKTFEGS
ncbi:MAG: type II toxin-antitoxin system Phd/YefM family antitoxin [Verrucomicrobia bacterium]|nr:type II toxin-antitoxin system Phd/YefM family antitoxin [Verrucomicrobiota bacterium]